VLRPRSIGEILDRGFTVLVQTLPTALALSAILNVIPFLLIGSFFRQRASGFPGFETAFGVCDPFYAVALYAMYASALLGRPMGIRAGLVKAWQRAAPVLASALVVLARAVAAQRYYAQSHVVELAVGIAAILLSVAIVLPALGFVFAFFGVWIGACAFEDVGPIAGLRLAVGRCSASQWKCATAVGVAAAIPGLLLRFGADSSNVHFHWTPEVKLVADSIVSVPASLILTALIMSFSVDARVRTEGLDLTITAA
jgi:hypothetical protein